MKKKLMLLFMLVVLIIVACIALVACGQSNCKCGGDTDDDRIVEIKFHYTITTQFGRMDGYKIGAILEKPEKPTYINKIFNGGYYGSPQNGVVDFDLPIENPRMELGYNADKDYRFIAWYTEPEFLYQWNFSEDRIFRNMTLYAKWIEM